MTGGIGSDIILTGNASFVNAGTFSNASSAITLANGSLTNSKTLTAASIAFSGTGSLSNTSAINTGGTISLAGGTLTNSKTIVTGTGNINLAGGALTNTGAITVAGDVDLTGSASLNNNAGTITANNVRLAIGTLINKGALTANSLDIGGGNLNNSGNRNMDHGKPVAAFKIAGFEHFDGAVRVTHPEFRIFQLIPADRLAGTVFLEAVAALGSQGIILANPLQLVFPPHGDSIDIHGDMPATELMTEDGGNITGDYASHHFPIAPVHALQRFFQFLKRPHLLITRKQRAIQIGGLATITRPEQYRRGQVGG